MTWLYKKDNKRRYNSEARKKNKIKEELQRGRRKQETEEKLQTNNRVALYNFRRFRSENRWKHSRHPPLFPIIRATFPLWAVDLREFILASSLFSSPRRFQRVPRQ